MGVHDLSESAKRSLRLICRQGRGGTGGLVIPSQDLAKLTAAGYLKQVLGGWVATAEGIAYDLRGG